MFFKTVFLVCVFGILTFSGVKAQKKELPYAVVAKIHYGFIVPHRSGLSNLIKGHLSMFEINFDKRTYGDKQWETLYKNTTYGYSLLFMNLGNAEELGNAIGGYPYLNFSILKGKRIQFNLKAGVGAIVATKPFNQQTNQKNIIYGSYLNSVVNFQGELKVKVTNRLALHPSVSFTHFSNGAWVQPNLGVNAASTAIGVSYFLGDTERKTHQDSVFKFQPHFELSTFGSFGTKQNSLPFNKQFMSYVIGLDFSRRITPMSRFAVGADLFYNTALKPIYESTLSRNVNRNELFQPAFTTSYGLFFGKMMFSMTWGTYLYSLVYNDGRFYQRIGLTYAVTEKLFFRYTLKSHFARADFFEFSVGYKIWKSK